MHFPAELKDAVVQYIDDRAAYIKHIRELTSEVEELEWSNGVLEDRLELAENHLELAEESLRVARSIQDATYRVNETLHKKIRELSRQLAGTRAAKTKLKKRCAQGHAAFEMKK